MFPCIVSCDSWYCINILCLHAAKPVNCGTLVAPSRGLVEVTGTTLDSTATYSCTQGYTLLGGSQVRTCQANGHWSGSVGSCRG